jgi:hypothetical protein
MKRVERHRLAKFNNGRKVKVCVIERGRRTHTLPLWSPKRISGDADVAADHGITKQNMYISWDASSGYTWLLIPNLLNFFATASKPAKTVQATVPEYWQHASSSKSDHDAAILHQKKGARYGTKLKTPSSLTKRISRPMQPLGSQKRRNYQHTL